MFRTRILWAPFGSRDEVGHLAGWGISRNPECPFGTSSKELARHQRHRGNSLEHLGLSRWECHAVPRLNSPGSLKNL